MCTYVKEWFSYSAVPLHPIVGSDAFEGKKSTLAEAMTVSVVFHAVFAALSAFVMDAGH